MSIPTREEYLAEALREATEKYDYMLEKQRKENLFSITGKLCTYQGPTTKDSLQMMHIEGVKDIHEALGIYLLLDTVKIYTQHESCVSTDCLVPTTKDKPAKHDYQYDVQIRIDSNRHMEKNVMTFVAFMGNEYFQVKIKFQSDFYEVKGRREEFQGGYLIKDCSLTSRVQDNEGISEVGRILWGGDSQFLKTASVFYNITKKVA